MKRNKLVIKLMDAIKEQKANRSDYLLLDEIEEIIKDEEPEEYERYESDHYDGPSDGEAWSGGIADNH